MNSPPIQTTQNRPNTDHPERLPSRHRLFCGHSSERTFPYPSTSTDKQYDIRGYLKVQSASCNRSCSRYRSQLQSFDVDRKSTRLNSSHANISYAVFCLKKTQTSYSL